MISRYEVSDQTNIWTDSNKFQKFTDIEFTLLEVLSELGKIPLERKDIIEAKEKVTVDVQRIDEIEKTVHHDVIAFCTSITEQIPKEIARYFHYGVTSSDIIDSAQTLLIRDSLKIILSDVEQVLRSFEKRIEETLCMLTLGRSHGIYAEPLTMGQKLLSFYSEIKRRQSDLQHYFENELTLQASGAVGNYSVLTPEIEQKLAEKLGLKVEPVSTQVIPRDRMAKLISITSLLGTAIERVAVEIRHLHRTEVGEVSEGFKKGQKGSSTMPHKKNPISGENLTGLARFLRSHLSLAYENCVLWHERDISHSSNERMMLPDHFGILSYMLRRLSSTLEQLVFHEDIIQQRVQSSCQYLSSMILHHLIDTTTLSREEIYPIVQECFFQSKNFEELKNNLKGKIPSMQSELPDFSYSALQEKYSQTAKKIQARVLAQ